MGDAADVSEVHAASSSGSKCIVNELLHIELKNETEYYIYIAT
jgi:hypothetical protein